MQIDPLQAGELDAFIDELWIPAQCEMAAVNPYTLTNQIR